MIARQRYQYLKQIAVLVAGFMIPVVVFSQVPGQCYWSAESADSGAATQYFSTIGILDACNGSAQAFARINSIEGYSLSVVGMELVSNNLEYPCRAEILLSYPGGSQVEYESFSAAGPGYLAGSAVTSCSLTNLPSSSPKATMPQMCMREPDGVHEGNPIFPATGEKQYTETDFSDGAPDPLDFVRTYGSQSAGSMAPGWMNSMAGAVLSVNALNSGYVQLPSGVVEAFYWKNGAWVFWNHGDSLTASFPSTASASGQAVFTNGDDGSQMVFGVTDAIFGLKTVVNSSDIGTQLGSMIPGPLQAIVQRNGWTHTYAYNAAGRLTSVTNTFGRQLQFSYNTAGQLVSVTTPSNQTISYSYDANSNLIGVGYPDGTSKTYLYENGSFPNYLTGVVDQTGMRLASYAYDSSGRAITTALAAGAESYQVTYPSTAGGATSVTDPLGTTRQYVYGITNNRLTVKSASATSSDPRRRPSSAMGLPSATSRVVLPGDGLLIYETDFNGHSAGYNWDTTNYLLQSYQSQGGNTTSYGWNATTRVPVQVATPGELSTSVYNGQPDPFNGNTVASCSPSAATLPNGQLPVLLCKKVVQATTDTTGASGLSAKVNTNVPNRVWTWTYNAQGQTLTQTDPRGNTTSYTYDRSGNRLTATNALGQTTHYTGYDASGNLLQSTDPNGVLSTYVYDSRQRLTRMTVGGQTTAYAYGAYGQVTQVTQPDGSVLNLSYDAAHRLTGVTDSLGNSVAYTLDGMGNATRTQVSDPSGNLVRQFSQSINALNQTQQITGME